MIEDENMYVSDDNIVTLTDGENPAYIISMDDIDLSLLPLWGLRSSDPVPLWSPRASGRGAEYFEFQVFAEELLDTDDAERDSNASTQSAAETVKEKSQMTKKQLTDNQSKKVAPQIEIYPKSGAKLIVPFDNYHGFYTVGEKTQCRVCRIMVDSKDEHCLKPEHKKIVQAVVKDKHCIQQLNQILNHCILCNEIIENIEAHVLCSEQHDILLKKALIVDDKTQNTEDSHTKEILAENYIQNVAFNDHSYFCKVCQVYIMKSTLLDHVNVEAHKNHLQSVEISSKKVRNLKNIVNLHVDNDDATNTANTSTVFNDVVDGYCHACKVKVLKNFKNIKEHLKGTNHILNLQKLESRRNQPQSNENEIINKNILQNPIELAENIHYGIIFECNVCDLKFPNNPHNFNAHLTGARHKMKLKKIKTDNIQTDTSNNIIYECNVCDLKFPNNPHNFNAHFTGVRHKMKLEQVKNENIRTDSKIIYQCIVCDIEFPNNPHNFNAHLTGARHEMNIKKVKTENVLTEASNDIVYECNVCDLFSNYPNHFNAHLSGVKHKIKLEKVKSSKSMLLIQSKFLEKTVYDCEYYGYVQKHFVTAVLVICSLVKFQQAESDVLSYQKTK